VQFLLAPEGASKDGNLSQPALRVSILNSDPVVGTRLVLNIYVGQALQLGLKFVLGEHRVRHLPPLDFAGGCLRYLLQYPYLRNQISIVPNDHDVLSKSLTRFGTLNLAVLLAT